MGGESTKKRNVKELSSEDEEKNQEQITHDKRSAAGKKGAATRWAHAKQQVIDQVLFRMKVTHCRS